MSCYTEDAKARIKADREAEDRGFRAGYLLACCNIASLHNEPSIASDILAEAGITAAQVKAMDLSEYDAAALKEIRAARNTDPITK